MGGNLGPTMRNKDDSRNYYAGPSKQSAGPLQLMAASIERGIEGMYQSVKSHLVRPREDDSKQSWKLRRNVRMMFLFRFFNGVAFAARAGGIFDSYIYGLFGDNKTVGLIGTLNGIASVTAAPVVGFLSDSCRSKRSSLLKYCSVSAVICLVTHSYAVTNKSLWLLLLSTYCWRAWYEFVFVLTESLFADSVPQGRRSEMFTQRRVVTSLANSAGPLVTAGMLYWLRTGDSWSLPVIEKLLHFSLLLVIPQVICLWFWVDIDEEPQTQSHTSPAVRKALSCASENQQNTNNMGYVPTPKGSPERNDLLGVLAVECDDQNAAAVEIQPLFSSESSKLLPNGGSSGNVTRTAEMRKVSSTNSVSQQSNRGGSQMVRIGNIEVPNRRFLCFGPRSVPWIIFFSHVIEFAGAGMTVKYFPLFFKTEYGLQPIEGCFLTSALTLFITFATIAIQRFSVRIGRPQASLIFSVAGILALLVLSHSYYFPLVIVMFILRGGLQNACAPIDHSMQMDYVPASHRGKWTALESMLTVAWAFSAFFGGYLADTGGYRFTFKLTALFFILSSICYIPLLYLVPRDENFKKPASKKA